MKFNSLFKCLILVLLIFAVLPLSSIAVKKFSVGVSPSILDIGEVEIGSSEILSFYIVTSSEEELLVQLTNTEGSLDFFNRPDYKSLVFNYSEEDASGWVEFLRNPVELKPTGENLETIGGGTIKGRREVNFILNVPENAEPGYHNLEIIPLPYITAEVAGQLGLAIRAVTAITALFKVPGDAIRQGTILDVSSGNYVGNRLEINTFFQNTGTVTISITGGSIEIYDKYGKLVETSSLGVTKIMPGKTEILKSYLNVDGLYLGEYDVIANVSYGTDYASKQSIIIIYEKPPVTTVPPPTEELPQFPLWLLIILVIFVISYMIYRRIR